MKKQKMYCGIDVSSETLDICYQTASGEKLHKQVKNNKVGFQTIVKLCGKNYHYVMESTGVYHTALMFYLHEFGLVYSVINALQIKRYIQMHLERNKTDKKDAKPFVNMAWIAILSQPKCQIRSFSNVELLTMPFTI